MRSEVKGFEDWSNRYRKTSKDKNVTSGQTHGKVRRGMMITSVEQSGSLVTEIACLAEHSAGGSCPVNSSVSMSSGKKSC